MRFPQPEAAVPIPYPLRFCTCLLFFYLIVCQTVTIKVCVPCSHIPHLLSFCFIFLLPYPSPAGFICVDRGNQHTSWRAGRCPALSRSAFPAAAWSAARSPGSAHRRLCSRIKVSYPSVPPSFSSTFLLKYQFNLPATCYQNSKIQLQHLQSELSIKPRTFHSQHYAYNCLMLAQWYNLWKIWNYTKSFRPITWYIQSLYA